jgi:hypothetical protein
MPVINDSERKEKQTCVDYWLGGIFKLVLHHSEYFLGILCQSGRTGSKHSLKNVGKGPWEYAEANEPIVIHHHMQTAL